MQDTTMKATKFVHRFHLPLDISSSDENAKDIDNEDVAAALEQLAQEIRGTDIPMTMLSEPLETIEVHVH